MQSSPFRFEPSPFRKMFTGRLGYGSFLRTSIGTQLRYLRKEHPDASIDQLTQMLCLQKWTTTSRQSQILAKSAADFEKIRISPVMPVTLILHPIRYQLWSQSLWGNRVEFSLDGPGPDGTKQSHPLLQWMEDVRRNLERERQSTKTNNPK